jgi:NhaA family Na+:H+ antiporter
MPDRTPPRRPEVVPEARLPRVVQHFLDAEAAGGVVLLVAAVVAIAWANSPWRASYDTLWSTELAVRIGSSGITDDLRHWVNDGLMALFFFVVGLEIKRELVVGELRTWRRAALPAFGALGGMVVPALIFLAVSGGGPGRHGWGIPIATDIAFAVGVASLLGRRVSNGSKLFLLTLAIVDDILAIAVIAVFYADEVRVVPALVAVALLVAVVGLRAAKVRWVPAYVFVGVAVWVAVFQSGIHATLAGVALGLLTPVRPLAPGEVAREWAGSLSDEPSPGELSAILRIARLTVSPAERLEDRLHVFTSFVVVPLFALANAGLVLDASSLRGSTAARVALGVGVALVAGKLLGVLGGTWLAVRARVGALPSDMSWHQVTGLAALAGIGFTVSLFVTDLAFSDARLQSAAKVGILGASLAASLLGAAILLVSRGRRSPARTPASGPARPSTHDGSAR